MKKKIGFKCDNKRSSTLKVISQTCNITVSIKSMQNSWNNMFMQNLWVSKCKNGMRNTYITSI